MIMGREVTFLCFFVLGLVIACPSNPGTADQSKCGEGRFLCSTDEMCIDKTWVCDGTPDCKDGSDETTPECKGLNQTEGQTEDCTDKFMCKWGTPKCIDKSKVCNDKGDCTDLTDEKTKDCTREFVCTLPDTYTKGIPRTELCDITPECIEEFNCYTACYDKTCYHLAWLQDGQKTFEDAIRYCQKFNGYLVEITDQKEQDLIWNFLPKMFIQREGERAESPEFYFAVWIGLSKEDSRWQWQHSKKPLDYHNFEKSLNDMENYRLSAAILEGGADVYYDGHWTAVEAEGDKPTMATPLCEWER